MKITIYSWSTRNLDDAFCGDGCRNEDDRTTTPPNPQLVFERGHFGVCAGQAGMQKQLAG